jgi:uncharacterized protein (DUF1800 family)
MPMKRVLWLALLLPLLPLATTTADDAGTGGIGDLVGDERIVHVLNRVGYGPRPGDVARVRELGIYRHILRQLYPERIPDTACRERIADLEFIHLPATDVVNRLTKPDPKLRKEFNEARKKLAELQQAEKKDRKAISALQKTIREYQAKTDRFLPIRQLASAKVIRAVHSERQLEQVMVDFWFNHFNVFGRKGALSLVIPDFEERALRPHAFGKFEDLLVAVAKHPAMLFYLDNWMSFAPEGSPVLDQKGRKTKRRPLLARGKGLNENYARELLELHTVGVDQGYSQKDIIEVARCFTGWTITNYRRGEGVNFQFVPRVHDAGPKRVMGLRIRPGGGIEDGMRVLEYLATHPNTAYFISEKLCRRFVADDPPKALVKRCAGTFLETGGDIRKVLYRIFSSPEFYSREAARQKMKKPSEYAVSAMRALGVTVEPNQNMLRQIGVLGEACYFCEPPTGFPDVAEKWGGSNAILARVNFATTLATGRIRGAKPDYEELLADLPAREAEVITERLTQILVGIPLDPRTQGSIEKTIGRAREQSKGQRRKATFKEAAGFLAALILGSPDFQMR